MSINNRRCVICGLTRAHDFSVTFHRFPNPGKNTLSKARAWAKFCWPGEDWSSVEALKSLHFGSKILCGRHFLGSQFMDEDRRKLCKYAIPTVSSIKNYKSGASAVPEDKDNFNPEPEYLSDWETLEDVPEPEEESPSENVKIVSTPPKSTDLNNIVRKVITDLKEDSNSEKIKQELTSIKNTELNDIVRKVLTDLKKDSHSEEIKQESTTLEYTELNDIVQKVLTGLKEDSHSEQIKQESPAPKNTEFNDIVQKVLSKPGVTMKKINVKKPMTPEQKPKELDIKKCGVQNRKQISNKSSYQLRRRTNLNNSGSQLRNCKIEVDESNAMAEITISNVQSISNDEAKAEVPTDWKELKNSLLNGYDDDQDEKDDVFTNDDPADEDYQPNYSDESDDEDFKEINTQMEVKEEELPSNSNINSRRYGPCRCCLKESLHNAADIPQLLHCLNITPSVERALSVLVCDGCEEFLQQASKFRDMVAASETVLLTRILRDNAVTSNRDDYYECESLTVEYEEVIEEDSAIVPVPEVEPVEQEVEFEHLDEEQVKQLEEDHKQLDEEELEEEQIQLEEEQIQLDEEQIHLDEEQIQLDEEQIRLNEEQIQLDEEQIQLDEEHIQLDEEQIQLDEEQDQTQLDEEQEQTQLEEENIQLDEEQEETQLEEEQTQLDEEQNNTDNMDTFNDTTIEDTQKQTAHQVLHRIRTARGQKILLRQMRENVVTVIMNSTIVPFTFNKDPLKFNYYECIYHDARYIEFSKLRLHMATKHSEPDEKYIVAFVNQLQKGILRADISYLKCRHCDDQFTDLDPLVVHLMNAHNIPYHNMSWDPPHNILGFDLSTEELKCPVCDKIHSSFRGLLAHMNQHYGSYLCPLCGMKFLYADSFSKHKAGHRKVLPVRTVICDKCGISMSSRRELLIHKKTVHSNTPVKTVKKKQKVIKKPKKIEVKCQKYECQLCEEQFKNGSELYAHRMEHLNESKDAIHKCEICGYVGHKKTYLRRHFKRHWGVKDYPCNVCTRCFVSREDLKLHSKVHMARFQCPFCGDVYFMSKQECNFHIRTEHFDMLPAKKRHCNF